jgi:hypothetical protein
MAVDRTSHGYVPPSLLIPPSLGSKHWGLLLRLTDEHNSFGLMEFLSLLGGDVILALTLAERHHRNLLLSGKSLQGGHEGFADRIHQRTGCELVAAMKSKEAGHPLFALQSRDVQIHPIDSFHLQGDVVGQHFGNTS